MQDQFGTIEKVQTIAARCFIGAITIMGIVILLTAITERPQLEYRNVPFPVLNQVIHPGDVVPILIDRCNRTNKPSKYVVTRNLRAIDSRDLDMTLSASDVVVTPGCHRSISESTVLPFDLPPGVYQIYGTSEIKELHPSVIIHWSTKAFVVSAG